MDFVLKKKSHAFSTNLTCSFEYAVGYNPDCHKRVLGTYILIFL